MGGVTLPEPVEEVGGTVTCDCDWKRKKEREREYID